MGGIKIKNNRKNKYILFFISAIVLLSILTINIKAEETDIKIVCSNSILADFTFNLITKNVSIDYIMPSGVCPAFYDTCPSDVSKIVNADIIISLGSSKMEPWLNDLITYNSDAELIECKDLGEWNYPTGAKRYVNYLTDGLSSILPEKNTKIHENSELYLEKVDEKFLELKNKIEINGFINKSIICIIWLKDLIESLGLRVSQTYGPPQGLSVQDELDVINAALNNDVCTIVDNLQSGTDFGAYVASESGASHVIFSNFPGAIPGTDTYLDMISYNTDQLINGIKTYEYKKGDIAELESQISSLEMQRTTSIVLVIILVIITFTFYILYKRK